MIGFGILYGVLYYVSLNQQTSNLNDELSIIVQTNFEESQQIGEELFDKDTRLTMISSDGEVLYDNFDDSINENHLQREEIKEASKNGTGSSVRYSETMEQNYLYVAEYDAQEQNLCSISYAIFRCFSIGVDVIAILFYRFCDCLFLCMAYVKTYG